ncbi:integrase arm-type DNA-binding domain-containing protein [Comamonas thiooxydans]|uniref:Integrase n=1 Tax=Comamonas thiooxydans TaxID=363952 RepID=A0A0E3BIU4_9BURK|nr:integrase arm-type DNA-binding domain-containing protein [Comamonas thiooxydans]KGG95480.1 integrase [Comamonas thiooxydans]
MALTDTFVRTVKPDPAKPAGSKHSDGYGLYLHVTGAGKYWRMAYRFADKQKTLALGVYPAVTLAQARKRRDDAKALLADGIDPSVNKREEKLLQKAITGNTFQKVACDWLKATAASRKEITQQKVQTWMEKDIFPSIGKLTITAVGPRDVLAVARKMEERGAFDSAKRLVQICGQVFRYAVAEGSAERDVTADLKGALQKAEKRHYAAITDPAQLAPLLRAMDSHSGHIYCRAALRLTPLVFVRPGELRTAEWAEVDFDNAEWRIPGSKMKMENDHIVPLSTQALEILQELHPITGHGQYIFPSIRTGERPMSENTVSAALRAIGYDRDVQTAHGFRATARTILDEVLGERVDLIEHQLAHAVKDANGRAYNRTAHLPARKAMMQHWADYLDKLKRGAEVIPFKQA